MLMQAAMRVMNSRKLERKRETWQEEWSQLERKEMRDGKDWGEC